MTKRDPRQHDSLHLAFIRQLPCCVCLDTTSTEACHIRYGDPTVGKRPTGMGEKPDDTWTVPLCGAHHRTGPDAQHNDNERNWWAKHGHDPLRIANALLRTRLMGDPAEAERVIVANYERANG